MGKAGRPRIRPEYEQQIAELAELGETAEGICKAIRDRAEQAGHDDWPSLATVKNRLAAQRKKADDVRRLDQRFHWPQSMLDGVLPWEAAAAALELLARSDERGRPRPVNRHVVWYYRLLLAAPDLNRDLAEDWSHWLAAEEFTAEDPKRMPYTADLAYEWLLAYGPMRSLERRQAYERAVTRERDPVPGPPWPGWSLFDEPAHDGVPEAEEGEHATPDQAVRVHELWTPGDHTRVVEEKLGRWGRMSSRGST